MPAAPEQYRPACLFCLDLAQVTVQGLVLCSACQRTSVQSATELRQIAEEVIVTLVRRLRIRPRSLVRVTFVDAAGMQAVNPGASPLHLGVTTFHRTDDGPSGSIEIAIRQGLPRHGLAATFAHELVHLMIAEKAGKDLPPPIEEGLAEYVAYHYLMSRISHPQSRALAERMLQRGGDEYGVGLRSVKLWVDRSGFDVVWTRILTRTFTVRRP